MKSMENTNKLFENHRMSTFGLIARRLGCSQKYVKMVMTDNLGKYNERDTKLVRRIREMAKRVEEVFQTAD